jgi:phosphinothricin acetyltransferase
MSALIRLAADTDAPAVQAIYAPYVRDTVISFELDVPTITEMRERIVRTLALMPWLVCEDSKHEVVGYVYASKHRERAAYQWSVDVTAYVHPRLHRSGVGRGLYTSLFALLRLQEFYTAYAGIALPNAASVGLHTALGFQPVGIYRGVGYKLGKWHDVSWWSLALQPLPPEPSAPRPLKDVMQHPDWQSALNAGIPLIRV